MGSMPPGCTADLYAKILSRVCDSDTKVGILFLNCFVFMMYTLITEIVLKL
jgi:hypothetical protein